jgi:hypothetical protein
MMAKGYSLHSAGQFGNPPIQDVDAFVADPTTEDIVLIKM